MYIYVDNLPVYNDLAALMFHDCLSSLIINGRTCKYWFKKDFSLTNKHLHTSLIESLDYFNGFCLQTIVRSADVYI